MSTLSLGSIHSLITKRDKGMWNERVVKLKTVKSWRNGCNEPKEMGQEHSIRHSRCAIHGNVGHSLGHVVSKIERLPSGQRVEHVA